MIPDAPHAFNRLPTRVAAKTNAYARAWLTRNLVGGERGRKAGHPRTPHITSASLNGDARYEREFRRCHRRRGRDRRRGGVFLEGRRRLFRLGRADRARPDFRESRHYPLLPLHPPAILDAGKHPPVALRTRIPARHEGSFRGGSRSGASRERLSHPRAGGERSDPRKRTIATQIARGRARGAARSGRA